jgi:hypothetical protein
VATLYAAGVMVGTLPPSLVELRRTSRFVRPPGLIFRPEPFPLRRKTLYGALRFAFGEIEFMINIKGLA